MSILMHIELLQLHEVALSARLGKSRSALLAGVNLQVASRLEIATDPAEQLLLDLSELNRLGALTHGETPLATWLRNAIRLVASQSERAVFERALARCASASEPIPPVATASGAVAATPYAVPSVTIGEIHAEKVVSIGVHNGPIKL